jgi:signal transduction histidine kinase
VAVLGLSLMAGLLYWALSIRPKLRQGDDDMQERANTIAALEREVARLKRIPKAELLPMLKLAHELRSPLAAVQNSLDMLLQGYGKANPELQDEMLNLARGRAEGMMARVNDFLRLGAVQHAELEKKAHPVQLLDVLWRLAPEMRVRARWRAIDLRIDTPDSLPLVVATDDDLEHLLSNLANNAIKYTEPGGTVTISLKEEDHGIVGVVKDTGIGIAPEDLSRIFDEFYRSERAKGMDAHGTGLGLAIAKQVTELYGGTLDVESEVGRGSKFTFVFPKAEEADG